MFSITILYLDFLSADSNEEVIPEKCSCENGTDILPPYSVRQMKYCQPDSCTCPPNDEENEAHIVDVDLKALKQKAKFIKKKFKRITSLCTNDTSPTSCNCLEDPESTISPPFDDPLTILECLPDSCTCEDGSEKKIKVGQRNSFLNRVAEICGIFIYLFS